MGADYEDTCRASAYGGGLGEVESGSSAARQGSLWVLGVGLVIVSLLVYAAISTGVDAWVYASNVTDPALRPMYLVALSGNELSGHMSVLNAARAVDDLRYDLIASPLVANSPVHMHGF